MAKNYKEEIDWENWEYNEDDDGTGNLSKNDKENELFFKDSNGNILSNGNTVVAIKDIKVKGAKNIKRGDKFTKIRLTDDLELIESGKMVLRCEFFKKI